MTSRALNISVFSGLDFRLQPEIRHLLILSVVAALTVLGPTLIWGIPSNHDLSNHFRFELSFYDCLRAGNIYPSWLADANQGFGDTSFRFYPPALYYLLAAVRAVTGNWYFATVVTFAVLAVLGALGVYFWTREFASSQIAILAGIFYAVAPYRLNQFFQATLLAEFAAASIFPVAFAFTTKVCKRGGYRNIAGLAATYAVLVLTHLPLTVIGSIALVAYAMFCIDRDNWMRALTRLACSGALGLAASSCYWITMLSELNWIRGDNVNPEPSVDYRKNFVLSTLSPDYLNVWWMNILLLCTVAMFWPAVVLFWKQKPPQIGSEVRSSRVIKSLTMLLALTLFMATPLSQPLWTLLRPLQQTQFPWRWLSMTSMTWSILLALAVPSWMLLAKGKKRPLAILATGTIAMSLAFTAFHIVREATWLSPAEFQQTLNGIPGSTGVYQWLPVWVRDPLPNMTSRVEAEHRRIEIKNWEPEARVFHIDAGGAGEARIKTFFYPHWKATAGNRELATHPDQHGALILSLPEEAAEVKLEFREPLRSQYAGGLTLLGWGMIGGLCFRRKPILPN